MINFSRAFDLAWERMMVILFRPFNFGKWCAIGLSAFLAGFLQGGNGFNSSFNSNFNNGKNGFPKFGGAQAPALDLHQFNSNLGHLISGMQIGVIILFAVLIFAFFLIFLVLLYWLGARGQFMFLDNVVRNRGAIAWPWSYYARQANSLFLFYLIVGFTAIAFVILVFGGLAAIVAVPLLIHHQTATWSDIGFFIILGLVYIFFVIAFSIVLFIFRELGVPLMFRHGLMAPAAFREVMNLVKQHPGNIAIFVLLRMAIFMGVAILSLIICCATCCIGALPYIGTVFLLPILVYVKCFTLDCLAQFGPQYDVWTVDVPPPGPGESATGLPVNPQPPPG